MRASNESRKQSSMKSRGERVQGQGQEEEDKSARAIGPPNTTTGPGFASTSVRAAHSLFLLLLRWQPKEKLQHHPSPAAGIDAQIKARPTTAAAEIGSS